MILLVFIFAGTFSLESQARIDCDPHSVNGFIPIKEIADVLTTQAASVSIKFLMKNGLWQDCSGAVVSDQGHLMTAGHCLENCSDTKELNSNPYGAYMNFSGEYGAKKNRPSKCIAVVDGAETSVDIKMTSECSFEEHQAAVAIQPPSKCSNFNEVAIILPQSKLKNKPCLPVAKNFKEGERVYTIGYPYKTSRGEWDSDGESQYASFGEIIPYSHMCTMIKNTWDSDKFRNVDQPGDVVKFDSLLHPGLIVGTIQTSADVVRGNSGGPLINSNGELIAVASFADTQKNNEFKQCKGSSFFSPVAGINSQVSHSSSDFNFSKLVCEKNRLKSPK